jgi:hypothetical protein
MNIEGVKNYSVTNWICTGWHFCIGWVDSPQRENVTVKPQWKNYHKMLCSCCTQKMWIN